MVIIKSNIHKKMTFEDKFARKYYCQRAKRFIRHQKKTNNKRFRKIIKIEIAKTEENE